MSPTGTSEMIKMRFNKSAKFCDSISGSLFTPEFQPPNLDSRNFFQKAILTNFLVKEEIFGYLKRSDLLGFSLVSKDCNGACREYLRRHSCILHLEPGDGFEELEKLSKMVENAVDMPFIGIHFNFGWSFETGIGRTQPSIAAANRRFKPTLQNLGKIPVKYVSMKFVHEKELEEQDQSIKDRVAHPGYLGVWMAKRHRNVFLYYMNLLSIEYIEHLKVEGRVDLSWEDFLAAAGKERKFENLRCADVGEDETADLWTRGTKEFLGKCPVLTEWRRALNLDEASAFVRMNKSKAIRNIIFSRNMCDTLENESKEMCKYLCGLAKDLEEIEAANLVLSRVDVNFNSKPEVVEKFKHLIHSSTSSLLELKINWEFLRFLLISDFPPLVNLQRIVTIIPNDESELWSNQFFNEYKNAKRMFPKAVLFNDELTE